MKRIIFYITGIIIIFLMFLTTKRNLQSGMSLILTVGVFFMLFMCYFYFEKNNMGTKEIAVVATLSAFSAASRILFAPIPNVQPVTFLIALTGFVFGSYEGLLVGSTSAFLSNIFIGQGPWTPWQMFSWGIVGAISGLIGKRGRELSTLKFSIMCFLFGFMFDWIMNLWTVVSFVGSVNIKSIISVYVAGLTFDILHGGSSFVFSIIFYESFLKIFKRYKRRLIYSIN